MADKFDFDQFDDAPEEFDFDQFDDAEQPKQEQREPMSQTQAAFDAATQGMAFGFGDELAGGLEAAGRVVGVTGLGGKLGEQGLDYPTINPEELLSAYREQRDRVREDLKQGEEEYPTTTMVADVAGGLIVPGGVAKSAAKQGAKQLMKQGAKVGAATGAVEAAGRTEEDLTSTEGLTDVALGGAGGGLLGGLMGRIGQKVSREGLQEGAEQASKESNISAMKSIGAKAKDFKDEFGFKTNKRATTDSAKGTGSTLIDEDILKTRQGIDNTQQAIVEKLDEVGSQRIQPAAEKLDNLSADVPMETFADDFNKFEDTMNQSFESIAGSSQYAKQSDKAMYKNMVDTFGTIREDVLAALESPNKIQELVDIRRKLQSEVNWNDPQATAYNEFLVNAQSNVNEMINSMAQKIDPKTGTEMIDANKTYSNLIRANRIAGDEVAREMSQEAGIGFRDYLAAGVISTVGNNKLLGPAVIGSKKILEKATGKDTSKLLNTMDAFQKAKKAKGLKSRAENFGGTDKLLSENVEEISGGATAAGAAVLDSEKPQAPYQKNREMYDYIEKADPETLGAAANRIREEYGEDGAKLASTLEKVSQRDRVGRRALLFSIIQDPNNRRMMGLDIDGE